ncbi:transpeptidase family protein [bacterium]|nr:transpeptidase family protein [bacterium]
MRESHIEVSYARFMTLIVGSLLAGALVIGRAAQIQILGDPRLESMAKRQFQSKVLVRPRRGEILDRNGDTLAVSVESRSLAANPSKIKNKKKMAGLLAKATLLPVGKLQEKLSEKREFIWIKRHMTEVELERFKKFQLMDQDGDLVAGLWIIKESKRVYPHGELAAHVLGDVNLDSEGLEGVELWADGLLKGKAAPYAAVKDALGRAALFDASAVKDLKDGENLSLTIDAPLQFEVEKELRSAVLSANAKSGTVIVMNAVSGEILAMANEPSFNPNAREPRVERRRNRAITDGYEPGSTLKPVLLASALAHGSKITDQVYGEMGSFYVDDRKISEAEAKEKFEWISLKKMIQVSSNVGAAKLALKVGSANYYQTLRDFGFGSKSEIGFPGEISGIVPPPKNWKNINLANIGFGQGLLVTPLQITRAYAAAANGGWLVRPVLLKGQTSKQPPKKVMDGLVENGVLEALKSVTQDEGTGISARVPGYKIAGKTGTAQMVDPRTKAYSKDKYVASFIGFPVGTDQKIVVFTSIHEPKGAYYGAQLAAPLFSRIFQKAANRLGIPPTEPFANPSPLLADSLLHPGPHPASVPTVHAEAPPTPSLNDKLRWSLAKVASQSIDAQLTQAEADSSPWKMPPLQGLTVREAIRALQGRDLQLEVFGNGIVRKQLPLPGKDVAQGSRVRLTLAEP